MGHPDNCEPPNCHAPVLEGAEPCLVMYPPLPIPASGFGGTGMGHPHHLESQNPRGFEILIVQEGAELFPVRDPPLPVLVPGCVKLGRGLLHLGGWEWGAQTIVSPQILTQIIEHFHHLGTVPSSRAVLPGAEGLGRGVQAFGGVGSGSFRRL